MLTLNTDFFLISYSTSVMTCPCKRTIPENSGYQFTFYEPLRIAFPERRWQDSAPLFSNHPTVNLGYDFATILSYNDIETYRNVLDIFYEAKVIVNRHF